MTHPHHVELLVRDHSRELMAAGDNARLRKIAVARRRRTRRTITLWRWRPSAPITPAQLTPRPSTQIAR